MKEIITRTWCDPCVERDVRTEGRTTPMLTIGKLTRRIDICEDDDERLLQPLRELIYAKGRRGETSGKPSKPRTSSKVAAASVANGTQTLPLDTGEEEGPGSTAEIWVCPLCLESAGRRHKVQHLRKHIPDGRKNQENLKECPTCGWGRRRHPNPQALIAHRKREHGYDAYRDALEQARAAMAAKVAS